MGKPAPEVRSPLGDDDLDGHAVAPQDIDQRLAVEARDAIVEQIGRTLPRGPAGEGNLEVSEPIPLGEAEEEPPELAADAHVLTIGPAPSGVPWSIEWSGHRRNVWLSHPSTVIER